MLGPKATEIRQMFTAIAPRYDFLNHLLSLNIDRMWRRKAVQKLGNAFKDETALCLDLCCGTGDLSFAMKTRGSARVIGSDFSHSMLLLHQRKVRQQSLQAGILLVEADALSLPFRSNSFAALAIAFGLRNLESVNHGLAEMYRVLKPGGRLVVLEFSRVTIPLLERLFQFYFLQILPRIGALFSKHPFAYSYLPDSVLKFPDQEQLKSLFLQNGFKNVSYENLSVGIAAIHYGEKPGN
ncbi:MAG: bifunctional demethylmenaquinone methyltransferase/2-methoxy-6-polyprenyl-1,4-benzoquinol methylase UbiE [Terriglobia bacterium]